MPTDGYILAIPLDEIEGSAVETALACGCPGDPDREQCAAALVRSYVCPCLLDAPRIIDAIATDFCVRMDRHARSAVPGAGASSACRHAAGGGIG